MKYRQPFDIMTTYKIPCNWDYLLLDKLDPKNIQSIYGVLPSTIVGSGRPSSAIPQISRENSISFIKTVITKGLKFNYLLNAPCLDAREYTKPWRKQFLEELDWILSTGARDVTVSIPYLIGVIKKHAPEIQVTVSSYARINSLQRALHFEELGADELILDPVSMTRNFPVLRSITRKLRCKITLIANGFCLYQCPYAEYHCLLMGHSSQSGHPSNGYYEEYPFYHCTLKKLTDPIEIIKAAFIRPEDITVYESIGITSFKLVDRTRPTDWILNSLNAYLQGTCDGDLLKIINFPHSYLTYLAKVSGNNSPISFPVLNNNLLTGLIDHFQKKNCAEIDCNDCGMCQIFSDRAVAIPPDIGQLIKTLERHCGMLNFG